MVQLLADLAGSRGDAPAVGDERRTLTWAALNERVNRWVSLLRWYDLSGGDTVAVVTGNRVEAFEVVLACLHTDLTVIPVNSNLAAPEIAHILADADARAVVVDTGHASVVTRALTPWGCPVRLVTGAAAREGYRAVEPLLSTRDPGEPAVQCCGSVMLYTSGTTGTPKGVVNGVFRRGEPLAQVARLLSYAGKVLGVPAGRRALLTGPWYHSAQLYFALLPLLRGCELLIRARFDALTTLRLIDDAAIGVCHLVPTQLVRLLRLPEEHRRAFRGASLVRVWHGGGPCDPATKRQMIGWWGPVITEYYAATEGGVVTLIDAQEWLAKPGSVGRAIPPTRIRVVGPDGADVPAGTVGRVFFRRGAAQDFHYHGAPDKTRAAHLAPGVYTYGELGYVDEDGYLFLTGRADGTIVSGGVNIYPAEVESALLAHRAVRDAAVVGVPDEEYGERVLAVVELVADRLTVAAAPAALEWHCRERIAGFKVPRIWRFVDLMPRDESGKLRRAALPGVLGAT